jgi:hypothetical protein
MFKTAMNVQYVSIVLGHYKHIILSLLTFRHILLQLLVKMFSNIDSLQ